jgi:hypothetical protein
MKWWTGKEFYIRTVDGEVIPISQNIVRRSRMLRDLCDDVECGDEIVIPSNLTYEEVERPLILKDYLNIDITSEGIRLIERVNRDEDTITEREANIIFNNPELLALAVYHGIMEPSFEVKTNKIDRNNVPRRLRYLFDKYSLWLLEPYELQLLIALNLYRPDLELNKRLMHFIDIGYPPQALESLVDKLALADEDLKLLELFEAGMRLSLLNITRAIEEAMDLNDDRMIEQLTNTILVEYNGNSIQLLYNLYVKYNLTSFKDRLPRYFDIDPEYSVEFNINDDTPNLIQSLIDYDVDPAYMSYLISQSLRYGPEFARLCNQHINEFMVKHRLGYEEIEFLGQLVNIERINFIFNISDLDDDEMWRLIDSPIIEWFISSLDLDGVIIIIDMLYGVHDDRWIELLANIDESLLPYVLHVIDEADIPEEYSHVEVNHEPPILEEIINNNEYELLEYVDSSDEVVLNANDTSKKSLLLQALERRSRGLVLEGLTIQVTNPNMFTHLLDRYQLALYQYCDDESRKLLLTNRAFTQVVDRYYNTQSLQFVDVN